MFLCLSVQSPDCQAGGRSADHRPHPLGLGVERRMAKHAACVLSDFRFTHGENDQAIPRVAEPTLVVSEVTSDEGGPPQLSEERTNLTIRETLSPDIATDMTNSEPPKTQLLDLRFEDVFVEDVHALADSRA